MNGVAEIKPVIRFEALTLASLDRGQEYITEASDLGWKPGFVPKGFTVDRKIGNGMGFTLVRLGAELFLYQQVFGVVTIKVLND